MAETLNVSAVHNEGEAQLQIGLRGDALLITYDHSTHTIRFDDAKDGTTIATLTAGS